MTITRRVTFGAAALILTIPLMTACGNDAKDATRQREPANQYHH